MKPTSLSADERRALRAKAHHLDPVVMVGHDGLTPAVLHEIDVNLIAHELIKIRVFNDDRDEREALLARIGQELDATPVQHIGKLLVVYRPRPEESSPKPRRTQSRTASPGDNRAAARTERRSHAPSPRDARKLPPNVGRSRAGVRVEFAGQDRTPSAAGSRRTNAGVGAPSAPRTGASGGRTFAKAPRGSAGGRTPPKGIPGRRRSTGR